MAFPELQSARDYNRGLSAPVRSVHLVCAAVRDLSAPLRAWASVPTRRPWAVPILWFVPLAFLVLPLDGAIVHYFRRHPLGGDIRRELDAAQQYGQLVSSLLIALVIFLQDPSGRRKLLNWGVAFVIAGVVCNVMKLGIGRPRPLFNDPMCFPGPFGEYPVSILVKDETRVVLRHAWEFWQKHAADLWSMPSSHTTYACLLAAAISSMYPRLRWVAGSLAVMVGTARVVFGAHYPSDVLIGAAVGLSLGRTAMARGWGERLFRLARNERPASPVPPG